MILSTRKLFRNTNYPADTIISHIAEKLQNDFTETLQYW